MDRNELIANFGKTLKPLYKDMIENFEKEMNTEISNWYLQCAQWGKEYPLETKKKGVLFYGRAVNGWEDTSYDVEKIFSSPYKDLFNLPDQMEWMKSLSNPFRNVVKQVTLAFYPDNIDDWYQQIAWSNVSKIAPWEVYTGRKDPNPNDEEWDAQYNGITKIMDAELQFFSPKVVVFITGLTSSSTGKWDWPLFETEHYKDVHYPDNDTIVWDHTKKGTPCSAQACKFNDIVFVRCDRPEFLDQIAESKAIVELIKKNL